jgi:hypothetical protein
VRNGGKSGCNSRFTNSHLSCRNSASRTVYAGRGRNRTTGRSRPAQSWQASFTFRFDKTLLSGESRGFCTNDSRLKCQGPSFTLLLSFRPLPFQLRRPAVLSLSLLLFIMPPATSNHRATTVAVSGDGWKNRLSAFRQKHQDKTNSMNSGTENDAIEVDSPISKAIAPVSFTGLFRCVRSHLVASSLVRAHEAMQFRHSVRTHARLHWIVCCL